LKFISIFSYVFKFAMSEVSSTANLSLVPNDSVSNVSVKRHRPGKRERAMNSNPTLPIQEHPVSSERNRGKEEKFAKPAKPMFQPGKFPVVFDTGVGEPTVDYGVTPVVAKYHNHVQEVYTSIRDEVRFTDFRANAHLLDVAAENRFKREFEAAALCTLVVQLLKSHVAMGFPAGDFGPATSSDAYHLNSVHMIASQYGEFKMPELGERFLLEGYSETLSALIRLASYILDKDDAEASRAVECWWIPTTGKDRRTILLISAEVQRMYREANFPVPELSQIMHCFFSGVQPPGWAALLLAAPNLGVLSPLFVAQRNVPNSWWEDFLINDGDAGNRRTAIALPWQNPNVADFDWSLNHKSAFGDVQTRWAARRPIVDKFFVLASIGSRSGDFFGGAIQLSNYSEVESITILKGRYAVETPKLSLAAVFWPSTVYDRLIHKTDAVKTTTLNVAERRVNWVQRDFK